MYEADRAIEEECIKFEMLTGNLIWKPFSLFQSS